MFGCFDPEFMHDFIPASIHRIANHWLLRINDVSGIRDTRVPARREVDDHDKKDKSFFHYECYPFNRRDEIFNSPEWIHDSLWKKTLGETWKPCVDYCEYPNEWSYTESWLQRPQSNHQIFNQLINFDVAGSSRYGE